MLWRRQQRDHIKKGSVKAYSNSRAESRPTTSGESGIALLKAPLQLPPLQVRQNTLDRIANQDVKRLDTDTKESALAAKRARSDAQAQASACWEDVISFLELHKLSGAYALAFSAYGIEDLSTLLQLDDAGLSSLLEKCNIDAMDEILLLEAIKSTRPYQ